MDQQKTWFVSKIKSTQPHILLIGAVTAIFVLLTFIMTMTKSNYAILFFCLSLAMFVVLYYVDKYVTCQLNYNNQGSAQLIVNQ